MKALARDLDGDEHKAPRKTARRWRSGHQPPETQNPRCGKIRAAEEKKTIKKKTSRHAPNARRKKAKK
ncbi:hypothetical protein QW131_02910 [Roseibium salinum]|nr:hypothetical protein [Roseibium salinum]